MTLLWKCDGCGTVRASTKIPSGWTPAPRTNTNAKGGWDFMHTCGECCGKPLADVPAKKRKPKKPTRRKPAQRRPRQPQPPPEDQGTLF